MLVARSAKKLKATRDRLSADQRVAHSVADAGDERAMAAAIAATVKAFGGVDILFANAGTEGKVKPLAEIALADFEQVLRTNVLGVWLAMKYCVEPTSGLRYRTDPGRGDVVRGLTAAMACLVASGDCRICKTPSRTRQPSANLQESNFKGHWWLELSFRRERIPRMPGLRLDLSEAHPRRRIGDADEVFAGRALDLSPGELRLAFERLIAVGTVEFEFGFTHRLSSHH